MLCPVNTHPGTQAALRQQAGHAWKKYAISLLGEGQKSESKEAAGLDSSEHCERNLLPAYPLSSGGVLVIFGVSWLTESLFSSAHVQGIL